MDTSSPARPIDGHGVTPLRDLLPADARRLGAAGMRTFVAIADEWQLPVAARCTLLGGIGPSTYHKWRSGDLGLPTRDQLERLSLLLGIYKALRLLFTDETTGVRWLKAANREPDFAGQSPMERMTRGSIEDLYAVRRYLDGWRGSWP
jgi:hypothetical protein